VTWPERLVSVPREHRLVSSFVVLALAVRLVFWLWTGRIWEDALITLTPAKMLWSGHGLTHHVSEPRIHSFTSPISELIPIVGESVGHGLLLLRLVSLVAGGFAVVYAYRAGRILGLSTAAQVVVLSFISTDQLQVFFGMAGMETQVATTVMLASVYALLARRWQMLGVTLGLCALCRPEFIIWIVLAGAATVAAQRRAALRSLLPAVLIPLPWFAFAWLYFGSPVPHTIVAKALFPHAGLGAASPTAYLDRIILLGHSFAPILEFDEAWTFTGVGVVVELVASLAIALACAGVWAAARRDRLWVLPAVFVAGFFAYVVILLVPGYFMWYLPPVMAVVFLYVGAGLDELLRQRHRWRVGVAVLLLVAYAFHIPFTFPLERRVQHQVEDAVRRPIGRYLDHVMTPDDGVVLEPLGYIGFEALGHTTWDYPGLSSKVVTDELSSLPHDERTMDRLVVDLRPRYVVFRAVEYSEFSEAWPDVAAKYDVVRRFDADPRLDLTIGPVNYGSADLHFVVLRREGS
jgi:hypothetical protein